jgi:biotin-(acetyl-CoA carboxylase) ligase
MVAGRKLGGVLPVVRYQGNVLERAILGVGCNVHQPVETFPSGLRGQITTLAQLDPTRCWQVLEVAEGYLRILHSEWSALEREGLPWLCRRAELYLEGSGDGRTPVLTEPGRPPLPLPSVVGLTSQGALRLEDGMVLDHLGREQRLRFLDEL